MYLSEIILTEQGAASLIPRDSYGWHKVIWHFFPGQQQRPFLFRVDYSASGLRIFILSSVPAALPPGIKAAFRTKEIPERFLGQRFYKFKLRANPTRCVKVDKRTGERRERGLREPLTDERKLVAWLKRKGEQAGFSIPSIDDWEKGNCPLRIVSEGRRSFCKKGLSKAHHASVDFSGILQVENAAAFRSAFEHGIGSAKSFGFGMLLLAPLS